MATEQTDVIVVGAGPIGLELAVALKRAGVEYLHFDAKQIGYTVSWFAPQTRFFSSNERIAIAGVPLQTPDGGKCSREQYLSYLRTVAEMYELKVNTYEPVVGIERTSGGNGEAGSFLVTTDRRGTRRTYRGRKLVLVSGGTDHPRRLGIPGEDLPHVSHYFQDPHTYFDTDLLVVGGKNSAIEAALRCHHAGTRVSLSYRRSGLPRKSIKYWLLPEIEGLIEYKRVGGYYSTVPVKITPTHVSLAPLDESLRPLGDPFDIPADFVLLLVGYEQDNILFKLAGLDLHGDCGAPALNPQTMETPIPGLYVAGTATGGTQDKYTVFIENCHVHVERILAALTGGSPPEAPQPIAAPES